MKAPRSARPVGADHSLQRAARFRFPKTGIVPAVLILCGGIWWWLSRTPDSVYRRTPGMREPSYRRACNPRVIRRGSRAWPIAGDYKSPVLAACPPWEGTENGTICGIIGSYSSRPEFELRAAGHDG